MKKLLALLTSITMLISVMPVMAEETTHTTYDAYDEIIFVEKGATESVDFASISAASLVDYTEGDLKMDSSNDYFSIMIDFGETEHPLGFIVETASYYQKNSKINVTIDDELVGIIPGLRTTNWHNWQARYIEILKPELCTGVKEVKFSQTASADGYKFRSVQFYSDETAISEIKAAYGDAYSDFTSYMGCDLTTEKFYNVSFGDYSGDLALNVTRTGSSSVGKMTFKIGDTVIAVLPEAQSNGEAVTKMVKLLDNSVCTGRQIVSVLYDGTVPSDISMKFVKVIDPYKDLLADGEVIEGDTWKTFNSAMFGTNGTKSIDVTYTGEGTLYICEGENADEIFNAELPQATNATITLKIEDPSILAGFKDAFDIELGGNVTVSQVKFNENLLNDQFNGATSVTAQYIGEGSDWYADIKADFEEANAQDGRTFTTDAVDISALTTDFAKLNYVKSYTTTANIVFVQAGDYAKAILDNLVDIDNPPIVMVVGKADYAKAYYVSAIAAGENALKDENNYKKPQMYINPIYTTGLTMSDAKVSGSTVYNQNGYVQGFYETSNDGSYAKWTNVDFSEGVAAIKVEYGPGSDTKVKLDVRVDSLKGEAIATFTCAGTGKYEKGFVWDLEETVSNLTGTHDLYFVAYDDANSNSWNQFGHIRNISFVPYGDNSVYADGLDFGSVVQKTQDAHNYGGVRLGALHPWPSYSRYFVSLSQGISKIELKRVHNGSDIGTKLDIRMGSSDGEVIATFDQSAAEQSVDITGDYAGVKDLYLYVYNETDPLPGGTWGSAFGDVEYIKFTPTEVADDTISYKDALTSANADSNALAQINGNLFLADGDSVTYSKVAFGEEQINVLKATLVATEGTLTVMSGETTVATIDLTGKTGNIEDIQSVTSCALTGTMPLTFTYAGTNGCYIKEINFDSLKAYSSILDVTNYSYVTPSIPHPTDPDKLLNLGVTVNKDDGYFGSMKDNYIRWDGVDFGTDAKKAVANIKYSTNTVYSGAAIEVYIGETEPETLIAKTIANSSSYNWGVTRTLSPVLLTGVSGIHNVFLKVHEETEYATSSDSSANIFSLSFSEIPETEEEYYVVVNNVTYGYKKPDANWANIVQGKEVMLSFEKSANSPESYMLVAAAYDSTGKLAKIATELKTTTDGVNGAVVNLFYGDLLAGDYTFKYFLWNGETLMPIIVDVVEETITSVEKLAQ